MLPFPIEDLMDEQKCYELLKDVLHPEGVSCPQGHPLPSEQAPHDRTRAPDDELSLSSVWAGVQHFHWDRVEQHQLQLC